VAGMDESRWPRPGPGMVVLLAVVGLIAGILAGLFNPAGSGQGQGQSQRRGGQSTTTQSPALPDRFYTVVLASIPRSMERSEAEARAEKFRNQGVEDVGVLDPQRYSSLNSGYWAIYSGVFQDDRAAATARRDELHDRFPSAYVKLVRNES
jgi:SPOR domain